jgi:hypothetical protein
VPGKGHQSPSPSETAFEAAAAAPPGTPASGATAPSELAEALGTGPVADILQQVIQDPEGFRAQVTAPQNDVADQLTKLAGLRDSGVLTAAEFEAQKQKLLGS